MMAGKDAKAYKVLGAEHFNKDFNVILVILLFLIVKSLSDMQMEEHLLAKETW